MKKSVSQILKATCASVVFVLIYALLFTLIIQLFCLPTGVVKPTNQVFKILAITVGGLLFIREDKGLVTGAIFGAVSVIVNYLLFSLIACSFTIGPFFALELFLGVVAGGITGIIAVNIKK